MCFVWFFWSAQYEYHYKKPNKEIKNSKFKFPVAIVHTKGQNNPFASPNNFNYSRGDGSGRGGGGGGGGGAGGHCPPLPPSRCIITWKAEGAQTMH